MLIVALWPRDPTSSFTPVIITTVEKSEKKSVQYIVSQKVSRHKDIKEQHKKQSSESETLFK